MFRATQAYYLGYTPRLRSNVSVRIPIGNGGWRLVPLCDRPATPLLGLGMPEAKPPVPRWLRYGSGRHFPSPPKLPAHIYGRHCSFPLSCRLIYAHTNIVSRPHYLVPRHLVREPHPPGNPLDDDTRISRHVEPNHQPSTGVEGEQVLHIDHSPIVLQGKVQFANCRNGRCSPFGKWPCSSRRWLSEC